MRILGIAIAFVLMGSGTAQAQKDPFKNYSGRSNVQVMCTPSKKTCAISYMMQPNQSGGDNGAGQKECSLRDMVPVTSIRNGVENVQIWSKAEGSYGRRIWMIMCKRPDDDE